MPSSAGASSRARPSSFGRNLRVLYTTGNFVTDKMKALFVEGMECLRKPYTQDQLQDSVEALLAA